MVLIKSQIISKQQEWFKDHKSVHITVAAQKELIKYAGELQSEIGEQVSISQAIEAMVAENRVLRKLKEKVE